MTDLCPRCQGEGRIHTGEDLRKLIGDMPLVNAAKWIGVGRTRLGDMMYGQEEVTLAVYQRAEKLAQLRSR